MTRLIKCIKQLRYSIYQHYLIHRDMQHEKLGSITFPNFDPSTIAESALTSIWPKYASMSKKEQICHRANLTTIEIKSLDSKIELGVEDYLSKNLHTIRDNNPFMQRRFLQDAKCERLKNDATGGDKKEVLPPADREAKYYSECLKEVVLVHAINDHDSLVMHRPYDRPDKIGVELLKNPNATLYDIICAHGSFAEQARGWPAFDIWAYDNESLYKLSVKSIADKVDREASKINFQKQREFYPSQDQRRVGGFECQTAFRHIFHNRTLPNRNELIERVSQEKNALHYNDWTYDTLLPIKNIELEVVNLEECKDIKLYSLISDIDRKLASKEVMKRIEAILAEGYQNIIREADGANKETERMICADS